MTGGGTNEKMTRVRRRDIGARYLSLTSKNFKDWIMHIQQSTTDMNPRSATSLKQNISVIHTSVIFRQL
jgi:hypothetical protein